MTIFFTTLDRMVFLLALILIGYLLVKIKVVDVDAATTLSRLENWLFLPALVMGTFLNQFTVERLTAAWQPFVAGCAVLAVTVPLAILGAHFCGKDAYIRRIFTYGLSFSNFGFMGNAVVSALFPAFFADYLIFTLPFWILIQLWGVPALLISGDGEGRSFAKSLRALLNPMMIGMVIGMALGLSGLKMPSFFSSLVSDVGACMSPVAMILTGITVAKIDLRKTLTDLRIYAVTALRLVVFPLVAIAVLIFLPLPKTIELCTICALAMPLGLNTVVVPSAYGRDTTAAAGMALISHVLSCLTIPCVFLLLEKHL